MKARIAITESGKIAVFTDEGTPEQGKQAINRLLEQLKKEGLEFDVISPVELHRHTTEKEGQRNEERHEH